MKQITVAEAIQRTVEHREVFHDEMLHVMRQIMRGELTPAQIAGFIVGSAREKGIDRGDRRRGASDARAGDPRRSEGRRPSRRYLRHRGDAAHTFNVSTCAAFIAAAAGARWPSTWGARCRRPRQRRSAGSARRQYCAHAAADRQAIDKLGLGFMFAPAHHSAMKYAAPVRKELGVRTLFNILGPLTNRRARRIR